MKSTSNLSPLTSSNGNFKPTFKRTNHSQNFSLAYLEHVPLLKDVHSVESVATLQ